MYLNYGINDEEMGISLTKAPEKVTEISNAWNPVFFSIRLNDEIAKGIPMDVDLNESVNWGLQTDQSEYLRSKSDNEHWIEEIAVSYEDLDLGEDYQDVEKDDLNRELKAELFKSASRYKDLVDASRIVIY